jgi:hypothetical protein
MATILAIGLIGITIMSASPLGSEALKRPLGAGKQVGVTAFRFSLFGSLHLSGINGPPSWISFDPKSLLHRFQAFLS